VPSAVKIKPQDRSGCRGLRAGIGSVESFFVRARAVWCTVQPSPGIALASLPARDEQQNQGQELPYLLALVNVIRACIVTSCLLMTLAWVATAGR